MNKLENQLVILIKDINEERRLTDKRIKQLFEGIGLPVDETDTNTDKNKLVSNALAKGWQDHKNADNPHPKHVDTEGNETIAGIKTFSSIPILPASDPTADNEASRKAYVDTKAEIAYVDIRAKIIWKAIPSTMSFTTDNLWRTYDATSITSANAKFIIMHIHTRATVADHQLIAEFCQNGNSAWEAIVESYGIGRDSAQIIMKLDAGQVFKYKIFKNIYGYITGKCVGYIE